MGYKYMATTPKKLTPSIQEFGAELEPGSTPTPLDVRPWDFAQIGRCYWNSMQSAQEEGGVVRPGWLLWELAGVYVTAEHHAVVERDGRLIDVTPSIGGETRVLFLPSTTPLPEEAIFTPNRYFALVDDASVHKALKLMGENQRLWGEGLADSAGYRRNDAESATAFDEYHARQQRRQESAGKKLARQKKKAARQRR